MKNKKNLILIVISIVLVVIALILVLTRQSGTMSKKEKSFAVEDTTAIKKIFLADSDGNTVLLQRDEQKGWTVNQNYEVYLLLSARSRRCRNSAACAHGGCSWGWPRYRVG